MIAITTMSSRRVNPAPVRRAGDLCLRNTQDLLDGGNACLHLGPTVLADGDHLPFAAELPQLGARSATRDNVLLVVADEQQLEQANAAAKTGASTARAPR